MTVEDCLPLAWAAAQLEGPTVLQVPFMPLHALQTNRRVRRTVQTLLHCKVSGGRHSGLTMRSRAAAPMQNSSREQRRAAGISAGQEDAGFGKFFRGELPKKIGVLLVSR